MARQTRTYTYLTLMAFLAMWLMVGIKVDDEFFELDMFVKYRPSWQVWFSSPLGMQDIPADYPAGLISRQHQYDDFVHGRHWSQPLSDLAPLLVQLFLSCLAAAFVQALMKHKTLHWKTGVHFLVCVVPTALLLTLMLFENEKLYYLLYGTALILCNVLPVALLYRKTIHRTIS